MLPLWPFRADVIQPVDSVICIRIHNVFTRILTRISGGYDYAVCYLIDGRLLVDTGFPWARNCLRKTLARLGADKSIETVVNTHYHEDHTGNNDLVAEIPGARIYAHPDAVEEIRFPPESRWYRSFLFGPSKACEVEPIPNIIEAGRFYFEVHHLPGHCPGHICLFEPTQRWLFSGDLYIAADLDSQLGDADGPLWIESLNKAIALRPTCLFDAHGTTIEGEQSVEALLTRKRDFLVEIEKRVLEAASKAKSVSQITSEVFNRANMVNLLSLSDGWLSLITGSDFSRGNIVKSFLRQAPARPSKDG